MRGDTRSIPRGLIFRKIIYPDSPGIEELKARATEHRSVKKMLSGEAYWMQGKTKHARDLNKTLYAQPALFTGRIRPGPALAVVWDHSRRHRRP